MSTNTSVSTLEVFPSPQERLLLHLTHSWDQVADAAVLHCTVARLHLYSIVQLHLCTICPTRLGECSMHLG